MTLEKQKNHRQRITFQKVQPKNFYELWKWTTDTFELIWDKINQEPPPTPLGSLMISFLPEEEVQKRWPGSYQILDGSTLEDSHLRKIIGNQNLPSFEFLLKKIYLRIN